MQCLLHGVTCLYQKYMVFLLKVAVEHPLVDINVSDIYQDRLSFLVLPKADYKIY